MAVAQRAETVEDRRALRHVPALDGVRAIAVAAVLCFHGGFSWMRGGFLGVSSFFTLSGFLIARLVQDEIGRTGRVDRRRFWTRRARRLLPAALLTLLGVLVFRGAFGAISDRRLGSDVLAAAAYVENWWLIHTHQTYGAIFGTASPVQHFWSLAIEEQFYLVFPFLCFALHQMCRRTSWVAAVFAAGAVASLLDAAWLARSGDLARAYYGTDARAAELLIGVTLAYALVQRGTDWSRRVRRGLDWLGIVALVVLVLLWSRLDLGSAFLFRGGTALNALCTAAVIVACLHSGRVAALLAVRPLRALGRISYGVYLVHWPVFLWLNPTRVHLDTAALFAVRVAVTLVIASVMFTLVERPIRAGAALRGRIFGPVMLAATAGIAAFAIVVSTTAGVVLDLAETPGVRGELKGLAVDKPAPNVKRVLVVGDSLSWTVEVGLHAWGAARGIDVRNYMVIGCGVGGPGTLDYLGLRRHTEPDCASWHRLLPQAVSTFRPDEVLVVMGLADLSPRKMPDGRFASIGDPQFDQWLSERMTMFTRVLSSAGAHVVWATYPDVSVHEADGATGHLPFAENDPARVEHLNALMRRVAASIPGTSVIDFAEYVRRHPGGEFAPSFRPDGVHLTGTSTVEAAKWLGPRLLNQP